jgi:uncharacterized iron-regulated membrane protein
MVYAFSLLSRYVVFVVLGIVALCLLSLTLLLIGLYGAHRWGDKESFLANIYCTVRPWIQRDKSVHTVKSRCACVWSYIYGLSGYMVIVANGDDDRCM